MAKIPPFKFGPESGFELEQFRDVVTTFWNYGKYPLSITTSLPTTLASTSFGQPGELKVFRPSSGGMTVYIYIPSAWLILVSSTT